MSLHIDSLSFPPKNLPAPARPSSTPDTHTVSQAIEDTLDLSDSGRDVLQTLQALDPAERSSYLKHLAHLLQAGVVGTETLEVDGRAYHRFVTTRLADPRLADARSYRADQA